MTMTDLGGASGEPRPTGRDDDRSPKELATAAVQSVKQEAASFAASAQQKASEKVAEQTQSATETLGDFASAIRKAGDELAQKDQSIAGRMVKQAADGLESLSRSVADKRPEELLDTVRDFGRRNPAAFIAGSVLLGIAVGRLAKSTEQRGADHPASEYPRSSGYLTSDGDGFTADLGAGDGQPAGLPPYGTTSGSGV